MARIVKFVKRTKAKGRFYYYFDTGQTGDDGKRVWKRLPDPADRSFAATYAAHLGHRARRENVVQQLTLAKLIALYQASDKFTKMAASTRRLYELYQADLVDKLGTAPAQLVERKDIVLLLDKMADRPGAANMVKRAGSAAYAWGRKRGHVTNDPFFEIEEMDTGEHQPWPDAALQLALASDDDLVRLSVHLLYYTAQRIGDVASMKWRDIQGDAICITQRKTGKPLDIPIHQDLAKELARHSRSLSTIIPGAPTEAKNNRIRLAIQSVCASIGVKVVPHGLRKNAVNALLEAGCSSAETAAISGQSLQMVEYYAKGRSQAKLGRAAMLKWEGT
ncbi:tyrosine-type recombinase/integrase [Sphingobium sp. AN558]|uniref:tyrosine-type recombinase/integrase n=1 Tax=Sphingobium sp. AN558 TaxID=3133442 RepID=UPI0030BE0109